MAYASPQEGPRFNYNTGSPLVSLVESPAVFVLVSHNLVNHVLNTILLLCKTTANIDTFPVKGDSTGFWFTIIIVGSPAISYCLDIRSIRVTFLFVLI
jgi:hypothetical protein